MSSYTTKFNVNDTAYYVDTTSLTAVPCTIAEINIKDVVFTGPVISYRVTFLTSYAGSNRLNESELLTASEAKSELTLLLSQKSTDISNLGV